MRACAGLTIDVVIACDIAYALPGRAPDSITLAVRVLMGLCSSHTGSHQIDVGAGEQKLKQQWLAPCIKLFWGKSVCYT